MPNPRYYQPPREPQPSRRDLALQASDEPSGFDPNQLMQMLGHLYGIQQDQQQAPFKQHQLDLQNKMAEYQLREAPGKFADEKALHEAQIKHLQDDKLPANFQFLEGPERSFVFNKTYPEYGQQQADAAAAKETKRAADETFQREHASDAHGGGTHLPGMFGLGAGIHSALAGIPDWLQGVNSNLTNQTKHLWEGLSGEDKSPDLNYQDPVVAWIQNYMKSKQPQPIPQNSQPQRTWKPATMFENNPLVGGLIPYH